MRFKCLPCVGGEHRDQCRAGNCSCRCRAFFAGPDGFGDPTAPSVYDQEHRHNDEDQAVA